MAEQSIIPVNPELIRKAENPQGLGDLIKPLTREIHLFDSFVSGVLNIKDKTILKELKEGDRLVLKRVDTKFDSYTIDIYTEQQVKIGHIPEKDNVIFARLMDAGKLLIARISELKTDRSVPVIAIRIYLVDY